MELHEPRVKWGPEGNEWTALMQTQCFLIFPQWKRGQFPFILGADPEVPILDLSSWKQTLTP